MAPVRPRRGEGADRAVVAEEHGQAWAKGLSSLLLDIKEDVAASPVEWRRLPPERTACWEHLFDLWLSRGEKVNPPSKAPPRGKRGPARQSKARNLLECCRTHQAAILAFMYDFRVPFDNNLAERDVRMMKIKQKISGAFRTRAGADTFCAIRSYVSTVRKQGGNVLKALHDAFLGHSFIPATTGQAE